MTVTSKVLVSGKYVENSTATQYSSAGCKSLLNKPTLLNSSASPVTFSAYLVPKGGSPGPTNQVAADVSIAPGSTYLCPEIAGARLDEGDFLSMVASAASALVLRIDGQQLTTG